LSDRAVEVLLSAALVVEGVEDEKHGKADFGRKACVA
jgi:hypothetical protein